MITVFSFKKIYLYFVSISILMCFLVSSIVSATSLKVLTEHLSPYQIVTSNNNITGFSTDIVRAIFDESGYDYTIEAYPWTLTYKRAQKEENTCIYSIAKTKAREDKFQWIGEIIKSTISFYALKENR